MLLTKYYSGGQVRTEEMGRACGTYGGGEEVDAWFLWGNLREVDHLDNIGVERRLMLKKQDCGLD